MTEHPLLDRLERALHMTTTEPTPEEETPEEETPAEDDAETARQSETEANRTTDDPMADRNPDADPPFQPSV